jgi:TolA-binding protein
LQQAVDSSNKLGQGLTSLQHDVSSRLTDQQGKLVAPVATLGTKVDQMSDDFRSVATNVATLVQRMNALDSKLADISSAIRTLNTGPSPAPGAPQAAAPPAAVPPMSADVMYQNAFRDYSSGKAELALSGFSDYLKYFAETANAPNAQYYIGYIYYKGEQWGDAVKAFDAVLERFPPNPKTPEALYYKAVSLAKDGRKTDAVREFNNYLKQYPHGEHVAAAHQNLKALGMEASRPTSRKRE